MLYLSFKFVRKFKFCVSPLVKRYPGAYLEIIWLTIFLSVCLVRKFKSIKEILADEIVFY